MKQHRLLEVHINQTNMKKDTYKEDGQILVIIVIVMVVSITLGVSVSTSFLKRINRFSSVDTLSRAGGVAEAAVEKLLLKDIATLSSYIQNNTCGADCSLQITGIDGLTATAVVQLSYLGNSSSNFEINLKQSEAHEVNLGGYPDSRNLSVCWNTPASGDYPSIFANYIYGTSGSYKVDSYAYNTVGSLNSGNGFTAAAANNGYSNCFSITGRQNPQLLRLKTIYADVDAVIISAQGTVFPKQGILIESIGTVAGVSKKITVKKMYESVPYEFDYIIYQKSLSEPLSN